MQEDTPDNEKLWEHDRPPRSKARLAFTIVLFLVLVMLLIGIFTPVRDVVINRFLATAPTPTPTIVAGGGSFYIVADPLGTITIDERVVTKLPDLYTNEKPLTLSRGQHKIVWQAPPFLPLSCIVYVPPIVSEPCNYESNAGTSEAPATRIITFTPSITDLPGTQQTALKQAIQTTLDTLQSTVPVQSGEHYVYATSSGAAAVNTATQPLQAALHFHLDANPASQISCVGGYNDTCNDNNGQSCHQLCASINGEPPAKSAYPIWDVTALFHPTWTYTTQSGQVVTQNQPDTSSTSAGEDHSIELSITWDGTKWHVSPNIAPEAVAPVTQFSTPPACAPISNLISPTTYNATASGANVQWGFAVGANEAAGCLGIVVLSPQSPQTPTNFKQPAAYFLYRFGILLAANPLAHSEFPNIPMANTYEQGIAQGIAAKLKF